MINNAINRFLGILCYPLISLKFQESNMLDKYFNEIENRKKIKRTIQDELISYLQLRYPIYSYDEVFLYLEKCYLYKIYENIQFQGSFGCCMSKVSDLAKALISQRDGKLVFKYWENENDSDFLGGFSGNNKILLFHSLNRHISMDLVAIKYLIDNGVKDESHLHNFYGRVAVSDMQLDTVLQKGIAENHLHSGASRSFLSVWEGLMSPFNKKSIGEFEKLASLLNDKKYVFYVLCCGVLRVIMANIIAHKIKSIEDLNPVFLEFCKCNLEKIYQFQKEDIYGFFIDIWDRIYYEGLLDEDDSSTNIIYRIFNVNENISTSGENVFLFNVLSGTDNPSCGIEEGALSYLKLAFLKYICIKNTIFQKLVQRKSIKGLDYFQLQFYSKNSKAGLIRNNKFWETAMREQFQNNNLSKVEFRRSIPDRERDFRKDIVEFLKSYRKILREDYCLMEKEFFITNSNQPEVRYKYIPIKKFPQVGLVYHLLKREDDTFPEKCYYLGEGDSEKNYLTFGKRKEEYQNLINILKDARNSHSELSRYIVGLDAASLENSTPVWVFTSIYENARDSSNEPLCIGGGMNNNFQSLGFTFHAGEDFRHILSGLRRIDEAVRHLKFHAGDRIGHAIALGIECENWVRENKYVVMPRIEALENYIWAYDILSTVYSDFNTSIIAYLENKIYTLSKQIYGNTEGLTTSVLVDGYKKMFSKNDHFVCIDSKYNKSCEHIMAEKPIIWNSEKLFIARHCKKFVIEMNKPINFEVTEQDVAIAKHLQNVIRKNISKIGIVVEINPTSNITLSNIDNLTENHIYNINRFSYDASNIIACVNADDPSIFNTDVSNELAYVYYGMIEKDVSKEDALKWIEKLRKNGIDSSFIRRTESDESILLKLDELIESI
ncbi:hypothetical protein [Anaerotignum propionicum]|uniref:Adenine deaminase n=1 Tax=Anaerotignum propionicum DSM 1682 TaxID=991789 RepID=A0A0X8VB42_ANAPI|nr:hypothetical protein [Anaerotignum propionicum]AMJ39766.1 adenine deaminase [Anaerotignum propionicum DSM 1682]SHE28849.1 hypothetical protein SAMN02745151_00211 [[Clostridium] propionicum DSM 1682] [Anaerotignum propionicum DSM 1682]